MRILFRILLISLIFGCKNRTYFSDSNETIDTLKYSYKGFNNGGSLYLLNNGKFIHKNLFMVAQEEEKSSKFLEIIREINQI